MNVWSATQRQYLEAMGLDLMHLAASRPQAQVETPSPAAEPRPDAHRPAQLPAFSPQFQAQLARAAKMPFAALAERVYLPPDLAQNPHAKRAFWHVLKGVRVS